MTGALHRSGLLCLLAAAFIAAPAAAVEVDIERSHSRPPEWTVRTPETDETYIYYVGRATGAPTLEAAETDAAAEAVRQIVTALGLQASFDYHRLRREADLLLTDRMTLAGGSRIVGLKRIETYYEKQTVREDDSVKSTWNAHVLARYPIESMRGETERLERESARRVTSAEQLLAESRSFVRRGEPEMAWIALGEALELTAELNVLADPATSTRLTVVRQKLLEAARRLSLPLRRVTVDRIEIDDGAGDSEENGGQLMRRALETALERNGFFPERDSETVAAGAVGKVTLRLGRTTGHRIEPGFHYSRWEAELRISEPGGDGAVFSELYPVKGFGIDSERAVLDALRKVRAEVFESFAAAAADRIELKFAGEDYGERRRPF